MANDANHIARNRAAWERHSAEYQRLHASQLPTDAPTWGVWGIPEDELHILGDVAGRDVLEYGCGGAQWSIALARRGARAVGLDLTAAQLAHARTLMAAAGVTVPLVRASGEAAPFRDASFDVVFCDHGVFTFCDPYRAVPEAARLLRSGGLLAFNMSTPLRDVCDDDVTVTHELHRDYFGLHVVDEGEMVCFQLPYGEWIRLFRRCGLEVEDLVELRPPERATTTYTLFASLEWARRFPAEHVWKLRRR